MCRRRTRGGEGGGHAGAAALEAQLQAEAPQLVQRRVVAVAHDAPAVPAAQRRVDAHHGRPQTPLPGGEPGFFFTNLGGGGGEGAVP